MALVEVAKNSELTNGTMKVVRAGEKEILLAKVDGRVYATQARCSHMRMYLSAGKLDGKTLLCPFHGARFDIETGKVLVQHNPQIDQYLDQLKLPKIPSESLKTYDVRIQGDSVRVSL